MTERPATALVWDLNPDDLTWRGPQRDGEAGVKKGEQDHLQWQIKTQIGTIQEVDGEGAQAKRLDDWGARRPKARE